MIRTQLHAFWRFLVSVYDSFMQHDGLGTAKSLTYTSLFAVVPVLTLVLAILSAFPSFQIFADQILDLLFSRLLPGTGSEIQSYLAGFAEHSRNLTWIGALMLLVTAYLMLQEIERCFNVIWGVREQRKGLVAFLLYWSVLSLGPLLLGAGFAVSSYVASLALFAKLSSLSDVLGTDQLLLDLFPMVLTTGAFTLLYAAVPNCRVRLRDALAGALVVTLSFKLVKAVFAVFITKASYALVYGTFAALPVFLMWLYVCWAVILLGANIVRCLPAYHTARSDDDVHPTLLALAVLYALWTRQQQGKSLHLNELLAEPWPFNSIEPGKLLSALEDLQLVRPVDDGEYVLIRDLESVTLMDVLMTLPWAPPSADLFRHSLPRSIARHLPHNDLLRQHYLRLAEVASHEFAGSLSHYFRAG